MNQRELPELHPRHQHQWTQADYPDADDGPPHMARCTVCDFQVPWRLAKLDGTTASQVPVHDKGATT